MSAIYYLFSILSLYSVTFKNLYNLKDWGNFVDGKKSSEDYVVF